MQQGTRAVVCGATITDLSAIVDSDKIWDEDDDCIYLVDLTATDTEALTGRYGKAFTIC